MDNVFLVVVTTFIIACLLIGITFFVTRRKSNKKYKAKVEELYIEKNQLIDVKILSEITTRSLKRNWKSLIRKLKKLSSRWN